LTLSPEQAASPAGRMLLTDAESRLAGVRVADRFPVALPWRPLALLPVLVAAIVLVVLMGPREAEANRAPEDKAEQALTRESKAKIEQEMKNLAPRKPREKDKIDPDTKDLEKIEAEIEKFARKARDNREDIRERIKDATQIEADIKRQQQQEAGRVDAL